MGSLLAGLVIFTAIVVTHLLTWRWLRFRSPAQGLLVIMVLAMVLSACVLNGPWLERAYVNLIFVSLTLAYLLTMPAIESDSPSSVILLHIEKCGKKGCGVQDLAQLITDERFVGERIRGMVKQGLITQKDGRFAITDAGRHFLRFFIFYHIAAGRAHIGG